MPDKSDLDDDFALKPQQQPGELPLGKSKAAKKTAARGKGKAAAQTDQAAILSYRHDQKRKNNPDVGVVTPETDPEQPKTVWAYDPHIDPALQFDSGRAQIEKLIDDALGSGDEAVMRAALEQLKRQSAPYLNWTGKAERTSFEVDTVSLHVHERIDPMSILSALRKELKNPSPSGRGASQSHPSPPGRGAGVRASGYQPGLFEAPFENLPLRDAVDFYKHEKGWSNRLISGDSLLVMNSLLQKESMAGQVQMIYLDPPYGIKYGSNFQPFVNKRDVKDRSDQDLTQEPEMIKAFRDTWELGIHSYLTYLRDRLLLAKELLSESGSVFVQINSENVNYVRQVLEEIFGATNFVADIIFRKKSLPLGAAFVETMHDHILFFAKNKIMLKYRHLYEESKELTSHWKYGESMEGSIFSVKADEIGRTSFAPGTRFFRPFSLIAPSYSANADFKFEWRSTTFDPPSNGSWVTDSLKLNRLDFTNRLIREGKSISYKLYLNDYPYRKITNLWMGVGVSYQKIYAVQTTPQVIERCLLMTTDPGDLVLDPTCGSGTTAFVAEKWGRRWITCDTSRVAVTLAKQRLMTASYDFYDLKYPTEGLRGGFIYKSVPHVTLKSIANNPEIDEIHERMHPSIAAVLGELNQKLDSRLRGNDGELREWEVPFDFPEDWPEAARPSFAAFHTARRAMQKKMDESIASHADREILYDQPQVSKTKLRISGPFTVEAVPFPSVLALDEAEQPADADVAVARSGETSRQGQWRDELLKTGIRGKGGQMLKLAELETLPDLRYIHAVGTVAESGERVAVSFGPEHAALEQRQVEIAMRDAGELFPLPKMLVFCAFTFDPEAAKDIDNIKGITALKVQMNTDLLTTDLKKASPHNQSFWLMGQPDVEVRKAKGDLYQVEVHGFDYFDTKSGELKSGGKKQIAMWALDTDYDDRSLFPKQVFFPMAGGKEGWHKLKKDIKAELDVGMLEQFHGTVSLPFAAGGNRRIAVKIVDDRGIESLKVIDLD